MAYTQITDVIEPEVFFEYQQNRTKETSILFTSGIVVPNEKINAGIAGGGSTFHIPFWNDLTGDEDISSDDATDIVTPSAITASEQIGVTLRRNKSWQAADLAAAVAGSDPMKTIADGINAYWNRKWQKVLLSITKGALAEIESVSAGSGILDISALTGEAAVISADSVIDARGVMGDAADDIRVIAVHSKTYQLLQKQNLIELIPDARGEVTIPTYLGMRVIQSDSMPVTTGVYTSYLYGPGAFGWGETMARVPVATEREELQGNGEGIEVFVNRRHICMHPGGFKFVGTPSAATPSNTELESASNWTTVFERKQVPIAALKHRVAAA